MRFLFFFAFILLTFKGLGQPITQAWLETNSIKALIKGYGVLFEKGFQVPKSDSDPTQKFSLFDSVLPWMGGFDPAGNLRVSAATVGTQKSDFKMGVMYKPGYDKIWRVTKAEVVAHRADFADNGVIDNPIPAIMEWPGTLSFPDWNNGMPLIVKAAPFYNQNGLETYMPEQGDFPMLPGSGGAISSAGLPDEMLFFAFNDSTKHLNSKGRIMGIQVFCTMYAYSCPESPALNNTIFVDFKYLNLNTDRLDSLYLALLLNFKIGLESDDFIGSIPERDLVYGYNGDNIDQNGFGVELPVVGALTLSAPIDALGGAADWTFMPIFGSTPNTSFPKYDFEFHRYLAAHWPDGTPLTTGGLGYNPNSGASPVCCAYPDIPGVAGGWSEQTAGNTPGSRSALLSYGPIRLNPSADTRWTVAFMWARGTPSAPLSGYDTLKSNANWLREYFFLWIDPPPPLPSCISYTLTTKNLSSDGMLPLHIWPNPARNTLNVWSGKNILLSKIRLLDLFGREVAEATPALPILPDQPYTQTELSVRNAPAGIYVLEITNNDGRKVARKVEVLH